MTEAEKLLKHSSFYPTRPAEFDYRLSVEGETVYITFKCGTKMKLSVAKSLQRKREVNKRIRESRTKRAIWEREHFPSRDDPGSPGYNADQSDNGRLVEQIIRAIDAPITRRKTQAERDRAITNAAKYIAERLGYGVDSPMYLEILTFISQIALYEKDAREMLMKEFKLSYHGYMKRLERYTKLLEERGVCKKN